MPNLRLLLLVLAVWRVGDWCSAEEPQAEPESEPEAKSLPEPESKPDPEPSCNIWYRNYQWTLQDCLCRPFQNEFLMDIENDKRVEGGQKPLVPVSEDLCINFIPEKCPIGFPVVALFPVPAPCGCNGKKGSIETKRFYSLNHLLKFSAENRKPFLSYSYIWPV
ncbi:salivary glue protein Sgs-5-like [Drosophila bipectinata]|uniref:salivary glue protein Sgs-5-like n=1 Tax=Drosophila bipectinata TaxID=42026 RepID=UPI001C8A8890|nr:salivary glue protein Sgs-5-like [Drosophila bipectinata]